VTASFIASDRTARRVWRDLLADRVDCGLHRIERHNSAATTQACITSSAFFILIPYKLNRRYFRGIPPSALNMLKIFEISRSHDCMKAGRPI
jgi:hypothetical protein